MKYCTNCGKEINEDTKFCPHCGNGVGNNNTLNNEKNESKIICNKCRSDNVNIQIVTEQHLVTQHHGVLWWLLIGWWWIFVKWIFLTIPALIFAIFVGKRKKIKTTQKKVAVCQNCGNTWNVK